MKWRSIAKELKGVVKFDENLKNYTSFKIGGTVPLFIEELSSESLIQDLDFLKRNAIPFKILGNATNLLIYDGVLNFAVLRILSTKMLFEDNVVTVDAGVKGSTLLYKSKEKSLGGIDFIAGIPGTVGGMIKLNAGAYNNEIGNFVKSVMLSDGNWHDDIDFSYRRSTIEDIIIKAKINLLPEPPEIIEKKIASILKKRNASQPKLPSAGSVFKKPRPDFYVGKAIDKLGLKGYKIGGAMISKVHAGFIVNVGDSTFSDVIKLIDFIRKKIYETYKEELELEINIWR